MNKAHLIFTKYPNSFSVHVQNLEELTVDQIQALESFVHIRDGVFDFDTYNFAIQKRLDFNEFVTLLKFSSIDANCEEKRLTAKQNSKIEFGKYKGMAYSDVPDSYLLWLKSNYRGKDRDIIDSEISYRKI